MFKTNLRIFVLLALFAALFSSCSNNSNTNTKAKGTPAVKTGVQPVADNEIAVIEMEEPAYGTIKIELYSNVAPKAVARFKELAREGFYSGTTFHRVNDAVIQGGDPNSKDDDPTNDGQGNSDKPNVEAEFSDIPYDTGIVGAARRAEPDTANSQFFITLKRYPGFDNKYTVFGKVIEGMNNVRTIAGAPRNRDRPTEDIKIKQVTIQPK
ncbi:MAG TPA: peptidylprolyl isomerase [Pyrinomonadaceae bacterium]|nr:peptidylprolyl isomerase [Pyrinomonadaceae bacterium]